MSRLVKTLGSITLATLVALSILVPIALVSPAKAQGTITLSSNNLHPLKVIEIVIEADVEVDAIPLRVLDAADVPIDLEFANGSTTTVFEAEKIAPGKFVAYLGGEGVDLSVNPANPVPGVTADAIVKFADAYPPYSTFTIEAVGLGITADFIYAPVETAIIEVNRDTIPLRRSSDVVISITIEDPDLNFDPTAVDSFDVGTVDIIWFEVMQVKRGTTGETNTDSFYDDVIMTGTISESAVDSGEFTLSFTVGDLLTATGWTLDVDDLIIIEVSTDIGADDADLSASTSFDVIYTYPTIEVDFNNQYLIITITSPDDNVDTGAKDTLDPAEDIIIDYVGYDTEIIPGSDIVETGPNTGVFEVVFKVDWHYSPADWISYAPPNSFIYLETDEDYFVVTAEYLDISGSGSYEADYPEVNVSRATVAKIELIIEDRDLNRDPGTLEYFPYDDIDEAFEDPVTGVWFYEFWIKEAATGNYLPIPAGYNPSLVETDFDSGIFRMYLPSEPLGLEPGEDYVIELYDDTGGYFLEIPITITPVSVELDRDEYPVNRDDPVVLYITLTDDRYNDDATAIETIPDAVYYEVYDVADNLITDGYLDVTETGPDTGVFTATLTLWADSPQWIDATITIYHDDFPVYKDSAVFKAYQMQAGDLSVDKAEVSYGECFTVTVNDPDANVDSMSTDMVIATLIGSIGTYDLWLFETDPNSGVFERTFCGIGWIAVPGDTILVRYQEKTPVLSPTTPSFAGTEYWLQVSVKVLSHDGILSVPKDWIGPYEFLPVTVEDPDLNLDPDYAEAVDIDITIEGEVGTFSLTLSETNVSSGVFQDFLCLPCILGLGVAPDPEDIAPYIGRKVTLVYLDEVDATGGRSTRIVTLTVQADDAVVEVDKDAVNLGDSLTITITNLDIANNPKPDFRMVTIRSTSYPTGITLYALQVEPGVFQATVRVVSLDDWTIGAPEIPAELGDTIEIIYEDPISATGEPKIFTATVGVGIYLEKPGAVEAVVTKDPATGAEVTPTVGEEVFLSVTIENMDIIEHDLAVIIVVRDPDGVAVARFAGAVTLPAGGSTELSWGWTPIVSGDHTVEVYIVDPTAYSVLLGEIATFTITVA